MNKLDKNEAPECFEAVEVQEGSKAIENGICFKCELTTDECWKSSFACFSLKRKDECEVYFIKKPIKGEK